MFYVRAAYLRGLFAHLQQRNIALGPVLEALGVGEEALDDPDLRLPLDERLGPAFAVAEQLTGDPDIGLHAGQAMQLTHLGILGHLFMVCRRLDEIIELYVRYYRLLSEGVDPRYEDLGAELCLHMDRPAGAPSPAPHLVEYLISGWLRLARFLVGSDFRPVKLELRCPKPADPVVAERIFQCPTLYDQPHVRLYIARDYLERALMQGDATLRQALEAEVMRRLRALRDGPLQEPAPYFTDDRILAIRNHVADRLMHGVPEIEDVAQAMGTSMRSLQRMLGRSGTNYKQLLDLVRRELAERYVRDDSLSLIDVALMLGFSDQTAFQRAFRRWFGETPGALRRARKP